jgi:hypothetical protein
VADRRLVGYLRVAPRENPGERPSISEQRAAIGAVAERSGWRIVRFEEDERSGRSHRRPGLDAALRAIRAGEADGLVVARLDRLTYSLQGLAGLMAEAAEGPFAIVAIEEGLDTSDPEGALTARILAAASDWTPRPVEFRAPILGRRGRPSSTPADVAERIRGLRAEGLSLQAICDQLNEEGVPTPRGGARWRPTSLRAILRRAPSG